MALYTGAPSPTFASSSAVSFAWSASRCVVACCCCMCRYCFCVSTSFFWTSPKASRDILAWLFLLLLGEGSPEAVRVCV